MWVEDGAEGFGSCGRRCRLNCPERVEADEGAILGVAIYIRGEVVAA